MMNNYRPIQPPKLQQIQSPDYSYQEYVPCESLASHVVCYWTMDFHAKNKNQLHRILPDGCVDIIVDRQSTSSWKAAFVEGLMTRFEVLSLSKYQSLFGIRFYPEAAHSILKFPASSFIGQHVFLEDIWGMEGLFMVEEILSIQAVSKIIEIVERKLNHLLALNNTSTNSLLLESMQYIYGFKGSISTLVLAEKLSFTERHMRRIFDRELGLSPKEMLGIVRFQSILQELYSGTSTNFTDIALKYGYYDQSHFIKNFKRYYGILPKQL
ncbi:AraC family transcriptional regulator [Shimazuella alba]|uniref:Helix-turn-helix domain-containing protein n=1 Tax=Shimazuella alba TaxID=2690964 RepID=A0A6I4VQ31_9BACL|nr:helix-turn-helix domain-containing protein [Shimazuella alba]MXQ52518.1 helix-turn-helix domain-containing protein [Shimazuella alba]